MAFSKKNVLDKYKQRDLKNSMLIIIKTLTKVVYIQRASVHLDFPAIDDNQFDFDKLNFNDDDQVVFTKQLKQLEHSLNEHVQQLDTFSQFNYRELYINYCELYIIMKDKFDQVLCLINSQLNQFASQFDRDRLFSQLDNLQDMNISTLSFRLIGIISQISVDDILSR